MITRTNHLPTHTPFFRPIMSKKRALHLFLKITFFCSLLLLLIPETLPNHLSGKLATNNGQKTSRKEEKTFFFFYNFFSHFPSLLTEKNKTTFIFFALFITGNRKNARENVPSEIFFFFLTFLHPTAPRNQKNYH